MAMLAAPRRRQRYNLTPKGKALYEDENNFGTKMLQKMGWTKGKGLGRNENGSPEFVRVRYKNDALGFGYDDRDDQWTQHETSFNGFLKSLHDKNDGGGDDIGRGQSDEEEDSVRKVGFGFQKDPNKSMEKIKDKCSGESLEEKSKKSRVRVHYKKFTRGKDISQYGEKDLANIFGKKVEEMKETSFPLPQVEQGEDIEEARAEEKHFIMTGLLVSDYFKLKMDAKRGKMRCPVKKEEEEGLTIEEKDKLTQPGKEKKRRKSEGMPSEEPINERHEIQNEPMLVEDVALQEEQEGSTESSTHLRKKKSKKCKKSAEQKGIQAEDTALEAGAAKGKKYKRREASITPNQTSNDEEIRRSQAAERIKEVVIKTEEELSEDSGTANALNEGNSVENDSVTEHVELQGVKGCDESTTQRVKKKKKLKRSAEKKGIQEDLLTEVGSTTKKKCKMQEETLKTQCQSENYEEPAGSQRTDERINEAVIVADEESNESMRKEKFTKKSQSKLPQASNDSTTCAAETHALITQQPNASKDDTNVEKEPTSLTEISNSLSLEDLKATQDSFNIFRISTYVAEKFRNADLHRYEGSNLPQIIGYGHSDKIQLDVIFVENDEQRINQLWNCTLNKYRNSSRKNNYALYANKAYTARRSKEKIPRLRVKSFQRKHVFGGIL